MDPLLSLEAVVWEREPLLASDHFQALITRPRDTDVVVVMVWSRLGTELPSPFRGAVSNGQVTGTEWEFEDALAAYRANGRPSILMYRKTEVPRLPLTDAEGITRARLNWERVEGFVRRWFFGDEGLPRAAFREFETEAELESLVEDHLRELIRRHLEKAGPSGAPPQWVGGNPYRGLRAFEFEDSEVFFGRRRARTELRERLVALTRAGCGFLLVTGASGSGKSSLVKAGVLPDLATPGLAGNIGLCRRAVFRPSHGTTPLESLARSLLGPHGLPELGERGVRDGVLVERLRGDPSGAAAVIGEAVGEIGRTVLTERAEARIAIVADQLEELFTLGVPPGERDALGRALIALARSGRAWVLGTLRADFLDRMASSEALADLARPDRQYLLGPLDRAELTQVVRGPAELAGVRFEVDPDRGVGLDAEILGEVSDASSLPMLSYLMEQLWLSCHESRVLSFAEYRRFGGLRGALGQRAEAELARLAPEVAGALPSLLRRLVSILPPPDSRVFARPMPRASVVPASAEDRLVEAMAGPSARLLVVDDGDAGPVVRVAHEALLTNWERARRVIAEHRAAIRTRDRVEEDAAAWSDAGSSDRVSRLLPEGAFLAHAEELATRWSGEFSERARSFVRVSAESARRRRRAAVRRARSVASIVGVLGVVAVAAGIYAWDKRGDAIENEGTALQALGEAKTAKGLADTAREGEAEQRRQAEFQGYLGNIWAADFALRLDEPGGTAIQSLEGIAERFRHRWEWRHLRARADESLFAIGDGTRPFVGLSVTADSRNVLATCQDGRILRIDVGHPDQAQEMPGGTVQFGAARMSRDGQLVMFVRPGNSAEVARGAQATAELRGHESWLAALDASADFSRAVVASFDGTASIWAPEAGKLIARLEGHEGWVRRAAISSDARLAATGGDDGSVRLWSGVDGRAGRVFTPGHGRVGCLAMGDEGDVLVAGFEDGEVLIWEPESGQVIGELPGEHGPVLSALVTGGGAIVATGAANGTVRAWHRDGRIVLLRGHRTGVQSLAAIGESQGTIASGASDGAIRFWNADSGEELGVLHGHRRAIRGMAWVAAAQQLVTCGDDGTIRGWGLDEWISANHLAAPVTAAAVDPLACVAVLGDDSGVLHWWDLHRRRPLAAARGHDSAVTSIAFSPDGTRMVTGGADGTVREWSSYSAQQVGDEIATGPGGVRSLAYVTGGLVVVSWEGGPTEVVDPRTGRRSSTLHPGTGDHVVASTTGGRAFVVDSGRFIVREPSTAETRIDIPPTGSGSQRPLGVVVDSQGQAACAWLEDGRVFSWVAAAPGTLAACKATGVRSASAWGGDGESRIAFGDSEGRVSILDAANGREVLVLRGHGGPVGALAFSPDGRILVSGGEDGRVRVWDTMMASDRRSLTTSWAGLEGQAGDIVSEARLRHGDWTRVVEEVADPDRALPPDLRRVALLRVLTESSAESPGP